MSENHPLRAGVAKSEITTEAAGVAVSDPLWAKVLVLGDGEKQFALITMDAVAIGGICDVSDEFLPALRRRIESELKIPAANVLVNASHTHPPGRILCADDELINRTFDAVRRALENQTEVVAGVGSGCENSITMNRNLRLKNGKYWTIRHANPGPPEEEISGVGPIDPEIGVLRFDRLDGTPFAVVYNFACHLLFGDPQGTVTANFVGVASKLIEETLGGDAMAFFVQGAAGDVIDVGFKNFDRPRETKSFGLRLGLSTLEAWRKIEPKNVSFNVVCKTVELPRRVDIPQRIAVRRAEQSELLKSLRSTSLNFKSFLPLYLKYSLTPEFPAAASYAYLQERQRGEESWAAMDAFNRGNIEKYSRNIAAMETLARLEDEIATFERHQAINDEANSATAPAEFIGLKIGDAIFVSAPIEILTEVSLDIKKRSPYKHTFIAAFSNGYMHYGPPAGDYDKGSYEVIECFLAPEWEQLYQDTVVQIIGRL